MWFETLLLSRFVLIFFNMIVQCRYFVGWKRFYVWFVVPKNWSETNNFLWLCHFFFGCCMYCTIMNLVYTNAFADSWFNCWTTLQLKHWTACIWIGWIKNVLVFLCFFVWTDDIFIIYMIIIRPKNNNIWKFLKLHFWVLEHA